MLDKFFTFAKSVLSEPDGTGSASRVLTVALAGVASAVLIVIVNHVIHVNNVAELATWLGAIPVIIGALVLFFTAPYGVNKGSGSISDIVSILKKKD
jgi:hypothetical protein